MINCINFYNMPILFWSLAAYSSKFVDNLIWYRNKFRSTMKSQGRLFYNFPLIFSKTI